MARIVVQMDPIETMVVNRDTSLAFMVEAQARGHEAWWYEPASLYWRDGGVFAHAFRVRVSFDETKHYETLETAALDLGEADVVLIRQDPPFDMGYISTTYLLDLLPPRVLVLNRPSGVRDIPEKLSTLRFPHLIPPTFVGRDLRALRAFAAQFESVVLKPSFFAGGEGVLRARADAPDFEQVAGWMLAQVGKEPIIAQQFLERVAEGDKRVFVLGGEPIGAVRRKPKEGEFRANLHVGGKAVEGELDERDREIAAAIAPLLQQRGILFAGLDVIDGLLTEINVTSPTLVRQLADFGGPDIPKLFWDAVETMLARR